MSTSQKTALNGLTSDVERLVKTFSTSTLRLLLAEGHWESSRTSSILEAELALRQRQQERFS